MFLRLTGPKAHWQAPTLLILAFIAGLVLAVGHHVFYQSLDGQPVDTYLFDQQTNLAAGHAFAFLVRACLCVAIGASYWQVFWGAMARGTFMVSHLDALAGLLGSLLDLLNLKAILNRPVLVTLALLSWLIPLASILPPATLSVQLAATTEYAYPQMPVPRFDESIMTYTDERYDAPGVVMFENGSSATSGPSQKTVSYRRASRRLSRLAISTAFRGAVPILSTLHPNSTYSLEFAGPAMRCQSTASDILQPFNRAANCSFTNVASPSSKLAGCENVTMYVSWAPDGTTLVPFDSGSMLDGFLPLEPSLPTPGTFDSHYLGLSEDGPASVFVATRSRPYPYNDGYWDVLNCSIYNASYSIDIESDNDSRGVISIADIRDLNDVPFKSSTSFDVYDTSVNVPPPPTDSAILSYLALMESIGRLLVGTITGTSDSQVYNTSYYREKNIATQSEGLAQTLLPYTAELLPFLSRLDQLDGDYALDPNDPQWTIVDTMRDPKAEGTIALPTEAFGTSTFNRSLGRAIEELFQNMTLSLLSDEAFLETAAENITITYQRPQNIYAYSSKNMFLSYGIALGLALIAVSVGCVSIYHNGASYSNRFSTILRTTRGQHLEELVALNDRKGADPLPKYLAKARISLGDGELSQSDVGESQVQLHTKSGMVSEHTAMIGLRQLGDTSYAGAPRRPSIGSGRSVSFISREHRGTASEVLQ